MACLHCPLVRGRQTTLELARASHNNTLVNRLSVGQAGREYISRFHYFFLQSYKRSKIHRANLYNINSPNYPNPSLHLKRLTVPLGLVSRSVDRPPEIPSCLSQSISNTQRGYTCSCNVRLAICLPRRSSSSCLGKPILPFLQGIRTDRSTASRQSKTSAVSFSL